MEAIRTAALIGATLTMGIGAGVYLLYAFAIMPGLRRTDDRTFVGAFQGIDTAVVGPFLAVFFVAPLVLAILAAALYRSEGSVLAWIGVAVLLQVVMAVVTVTINVPLNDAIKSAGHPSEITDIVVVRKQFNEPRWVQANLVRALGATVASGCLAWSLVVAERI